MEDADSDSGIDSDGDWYHAGRDELYGLRTNSHAVGPDGAHRRRFLCGEEKKGGTRWGCLSFVETVYHFIKKINLHCPRVTVPLWNMEVEGISTEQVIRRTYS